MAETPDELRVYTQGVYDSVLVEPSDWSDQNDASFSRSLHVKYDHQLTRLLAQYEQKIPSVIGDYEEALNVLSSYLTNFNISGIQLRGDLGKQNSKVFRLVDKWLAVKREVEGRTKGYFTRNPVGTDYYLDPTNGSNSSPHDGLRHPTSGTYTMDAGSGTTTLIETSQLPRTTDDDWNGAYLYNVTRSTGVIITDSAYSGGTWTLTHPTITGQTSGDTYFIIDAWATLAQYTTTTSRSAGDRLFVRANDTETLSADVLHDENGDADNPIEIIGCDSTTNDPWNDSSDVKPDFDFNGTSFQFDISGNWGWHYERVEILDSHDSVMINHGGGGSGMCTWKDCKFYEFGGNWNSMVGLGNAAGAITFENCAWDEVGANNYAVTVSNGFGVFKNCTFDAGSVSQGRLGLTSVGGRAVLIDCVFGGTTSFSYRDVDAGSYMIEVYARNCDFDIDPVPAHLGNGRSVIFMEDSEQSLGVGKIVCSRGTVEKDTTIKTGNADYSHKLTPVASTDVAHFLELTGGRWEQFAPFVVEGTASQQNTITVKIRALGTWSTYPTASELYLQASYYDSGSDLGRSTVKSTQVLNHATNWIDFSVTCTPLRDGPIYLNVYLGVYEDAGDGCYVNGEVT